MYHWLLVPLLLLEPENLLATLYLNFTGHTKLMPLPVRAGDTGRAGDIAMQLCASEQLGDAGCDYLRQYLTNEFMNIELAGVAN